MRVTLLYKPTTDQLNMETDELASRKKKIINTHSKLNDFFSRFFFRVLNIFASCRYSNYKIMPSIVYPSF